MSVSTRIALLAAALVLVPASPSGAKAPPVGRYDCTIGTANLGFGTLTIRSHNRYSHRRTKGRFEHGHAKVTFGDGKQGWRISFKSGGLKGFKGRWYKASDGTPEGNYEIALKNPKNGIESIYCDKRK